MSVGVGEEYDNMHSTVCALGDMIPALYEYCGAQLLEMVYLVHTLILCHRSHNNTSKVSNRVVKGANLFGTIRSCTGPPFGYHPPRNIAQKM